ncbi:MAG: Crp/Fnr family transcriptional regulator [Oscillospiraceae bacterium]
MKEFFPVLRSSQLFSGVSEEELTAMLTCLGAEKRSFPKEAFLLRSGDTAESIGLVLSGSVLVIQEDIWGNRNILSKAGPGQTFAAAYACAPGSVLNVSVVAETPVTVLLMNVKRILNVCPSACTHHSRIIQPAGGAGGRTCALAKSSPTWASAPHGPSSCPTLREAQRLGTYEFDVPFSVSSWRIIWRWSAAACRWSWGK